MLITIVGVGLLSYPRISHYLAELNGSRAIQVYSEAVSQFSEEELEDALDEAKLYNENLTGTPVHDPFIEGTGMAMPEDYFRVLNVDSVMGYLEIPKIGVYLPIYHGTSEEVLVKGVGHLEGSTLPVGGEDRHCVLTGHTGLIHARLFTDLIELEEGDMFYLHVLGETLAYKVDLIKVVEPQVSDDLKRTGKGDDFCTLLTCTPYGINSHRLLVRAARTEYIPEVYTAIETNSKSTIDALVTAAALVTIVVMEAIIFAVLFVLRKNRIQRRSYLHLRYV